MRYRKFLDRAAEVHPILRILGFGVPMALVMFAYTALLYSDSALFAHGLLVGLLFCVISGLGAGLLFEHFVRSGRFKNVQPLEPPARPAPTDAADTPGVRRVHR